MLLLEVVGELAVILAAVLAQEFLVLVHVAG
jgi:hypothetical protein